MTTWREMSLDNRNAARALIRAGLFRSGISRAYYAAYCALTSHLSPRLTFGHRDNPAHVDLSRLIMNHLDHLPEEKRQELRKAVAELWKQRVEADYIPAASIDKNIATGALRSADRALFILGVTD